MGTLVLLNRLLHHAYTIASKVKTIMENRKERRLNL
jgi:hypothetical protein